ncbi:MAG: respiratory nitrate reductase subunit gamma [Hyphomicrobiales bacterium]|nr:respiratory nitrate reductase subunit gamma [Hyphomicrobiales bacterium]
MANLDCWWSIWNCVFYRHGNLDHSRFGNERVNATSSFWDKSILLTLLCSWYLGLLSIFQSAQHMGGSSMVELAHWAQKLVTFQGGAVEHIAHEHYVFKLHIVL